MRQNETILTDSIPIENFFEKPKFYGVRYKFNINRNLNGTSQRLGCPFFIALRTVKPELKVRLLPPASKDYEQEIQQKQMESYQEPCAQERPL